MAWKVNYVQSVLCYLDILGFRGIIEEKSAAEISRILRLLAVKPNPDPIFQTNPLFTKFSDPVIRSVPVDVHRPYAIISELRSVLIAQVRLIEEGICIRGAITIGDVVQSWNIVYGPAVVKAYTLEQGGPPVIRVDREAIDEMKPHLEREHFGEVLATLLATDGEITGSGANRE